MVLGVPILKHFRVCFSSILLQGTPLVTSRLPGGGKKTYLKPFALQTAKTSFGRSDCKRVNQEDR